MTRLRRGARIELGEAISFEDVLTIITVLLLLRVIFMVPLVNLDKSKTVAARSDAYWSRQAAYVLSAPADSARSKPYADAFALHGKSALLTETGAGETLYLEAVGADSSLLILRHDLGGGAFIAMNVQGPGHALSFRRGTLLWSQDESEWFPASDSVDYGTRPESKAMEAEFRAWTKARRGY